MKSLKISRTVALAVVVVFAFTLGAQAQDRDRRVSPAFPIGAGEEMLVLAPTSSSVVQPFGSVGYTRTATGVRQIPINLPVGTTIKRILGDFVDQSGSFDMTIRLLRVSNADMVTNIELRSFDTSGISSSSATDFKQIVANPMSHSMLQGWTYWVVIEFPGGHSTNELVAGVIKIIYEP